MPDDLPPISQDLNDPLPTVDPNSDLVPYRLSNAQGGITTGYGARARPPIQPPEGFGGGVGMPNLDQIYQAAFSKLPVEQAVQATNAASKYVGQRMLGQALASARTPEEMNNAYAKFGYLAFGNGQAIPEILRAQIERQKLTAPPTPQQIILNQQHAAQEKRLQDEATFKQTQVSPDVRYRVDAENARAAAKDAAAAKAKAEASANKLSDADKALLASDKTELTGLAKQIGGTEEHGFGIMHPFGGNKSEVEALRAKADALRKHIKDTYGPKSKGQNPAGTRVKVRDKDGKTGSIPADQLDAAIEAGFTEVK